MSGGTLIALAADEILMDPHAVLGPVDPQLTDGQGAYAASSIVKAVKEKPIDKVSDRTLILADDARKALEQMRDLIREILKGKCGEDRTSLVIEELVSGKYTHDYPIFLIRPGSCWATASRREYPGASTTSWTFTRRSRGLGSRGSSTYRGAPERQQRR